MLTIDEHPLLHLAAFETRFEAPLASQPSPDWLSALLNLEADAPLARSEEKRAAVRDLLRHGGYKPTGRGKPASEYLVRAAGEATLAAINLAVDACNVVSLHSGVPISVVDLDRTQPPLRVGIAPEDARYVFNPSGQEIRIGGLLCLIDAEGPCANAVKDAMRTKTHEGTRRTLSLLWGPLTFADDADRACAWYRELLERAGASTADVC
jgi:DNA/RNA-binding domain of Phe-tRNA-synthetase-like protein